MFCIGGGILVAILVLMGVVICLYYKIADALRWVMWVGVTNPPSNRIPGAPGLSKVIACPVVPPGERSGTAGGFEEVKPGEYRMLVFSPSGLGLWAHEQNVLGWVALCSVVSLPLTEWPLSRPAQHTGWALIRARNRRLWRRLGMSLYFRVPRRTGWTDLLFAGLGELSRCSVIHCA